MGADPKIFKKFWSEVQIYFLKCGSYWDTWRKFLYLFLRSPSHKHMQPPLKITLPLPWRLVSNLSHPGLNIWQRCSNPQFSFLMYRMQFEKGQDFANLIYLFPKAEKCLFSYAWLPHPPGIRVTVFLFGSETIISSQSLGLSYSRQLSREGKNNSNRRLPTACSTVARERIAVLQLNIYS